MCAGQTLIVDVTSASIGRDHLKLRRLSEVTGVPIVMGCGHYVDASLSVETRNASIDALAREMIEDIRVGVSGSGVKAGVIGEIGASNPLTRAEENILRAAVFAQKETEAAIIVHSPSGIEGPLIMADFLEAAGADTSRVVLCHLDARFGGDTALYTALATRGFVLAMDTFGRDIYVEFLRKQHPNDTTRIETLVALCEAGLERQILVSQDICLKSEFYHFGGRGYAHILDTLVPRILRAGISTRTLENILIENPRRMLTLRKRVSRRKCGANW